MKAVQKNLLLFAMTMAFIATSSLWADNQGFRLAPRDPSLSAMVPDGANPRNRASMRRCHTPLECIRMAALAKRALANLPPGTVFDELAQISPADDVSR